LNAFLGTVATGQVGGALVQDVVDDGVLGHRDPTGVLRVDGYGVVRPGRA
jgi:hypothetical protein